ncbi:MAG: hypothetical protein ACE5GX_17630 [Thermoanaerobaculia bacterium]
MPRARHLAVNLGASGLLGGTVAVSISSPYWWPLFAAGGALLFGGLNAYTKADRAPARFDVTDPRLWITYLSYVFAGASIETLRLILGLWSYNGYWETLPSIVALILIGYPLLFLFTLEVFLVTRRLSKRAWVAAVIACVVLAAWNEIPNLLAPMWTLADAHRGLVSWLSATGYPLETLVAVAAYELPR